jgi:hypothetical protein
VHNGRVYQADMRNYFKKAALFLSAFLVFIAISCEAPRENPVDPKNPDNNLSSINGVVKTKGFPFIPIENVYVFWENDNILVRTDENGKYEIPNAVRRNGWLMFQGEGYSNDSTFINWQENNSFSGEIFLNSIPNLDSLEFYSVVVNRFQFNQRYSLGVRARVSDFEGVNDIVTVAIDNEEINLYKILTYDPAEDYYIGELTLRDLNISSLNEIIGKDFRILVIDIDDNDFIVGITNIKRIINEEVELISPINNESVSEPFKLNWTRFLPGYKFTYRVEIYTNETSPILVYSQAEIAQDSISHSVNSHFDGSNYFWVIWAIDEFKNQSRSKPGSFIIEN